MKYLIELQYTTSSGDFGYEYIDTMTIECDNILNFFNKAIRELPEYSYNINVVDIKPRQFFETYPYLDYQILTNIFDKISGTINHIKLLQSLNVSLKNNINIEEERINTEYYKKQLENMKNKYSECFRHINELQVYINTLIADSIE